MAKYVEKWDLPALAAAQNPADVIIYIRHHFQRCHQRPRGDRPVQLLLHLLCRSINFGAEGRYAAGSACEKGGRVQSVLHLLHPPSDLGGFADAAACSWAAALRKDGQCSSCCTAPPHW